MPATFRSISTGFGLSPVVTKPAGCVDGDTLLAIVRPGFGATVASPPTGGATWQHLRTDNFTANHRWYIYWKVAASEPASQTWVGAGGNNVEVHVLCAAGSHAVSPINAHDLTTSGVDGLSIDTPPVTTDVDGGLIVHVGTEYGAGGVTATWSSGVTERSDSGGAGLGLSVATEEQTAKGTTTPRRVTWSGFVGASSQAALTVALAPAAPDVLHGEWHGEDHSGTAVYVADPMRVRMIV